MDIWQIVNGPLFPRYFNAAASLFWAAMLGFAVWKQRFNFGGQAVFGRSLVFTRTDSPKTYWALAAAYATIVLWLALAAVLNWGHR